MNKTIPFIASASLALALLIATPVAFAAHGSRSPIPEKSGTYDDPDHPGVKVRVFSHPERPTKTQSSALACNLPDPDSTDTIGAHWLETCFKRDIPTKPQQRSLLSRQR